MHFIYCEQAKTKWGYLSTVYLSTPGELSTSCWSSCDKWQSCRFNSRRASNMCHDSFSPQLSKCWLLHGEMRSAIKANLSLYSCVNPAMFNQPRSLRAPGRRHESKASIHIQSRGLGSEWLIQYENPNPKPTPVCFLISDTWKCGSEITVNTTSVLWGGPKRNPIGLKSACPWKNTAILFLHSCHKITDSSFFFS